MSLINDALRRARDAQRNDPPSGARSLPPVESPAHTGTGWMLAAAVVLLLAAAGVFLCLALFGHKMPPSVTVKTPGITAPPPVVAETSTVSITNAPPPPASSTGPPPATIVTEQWPKVQGIIFIATRPLAIVSNQTVKAGDRVGDVQVKQILKDSVIFQQPDGSQKTLGIGE